MTASMKVRFTALDTAVQMNDMNRHLASAQHIAVTPEKLIDDAKKIEAYLQNGRAPKL